MNSIVSNLLGRILEKFGNKRKKERAEEIFDRMDFDKKTEFFNQHGVKMEELEKMYTRANWIKENCKTTIEWDKKFIGRNKSIEFIS
jgi:uncharacterized coiled-coil DUF342 family protein